MYHFNYGQGAKRALSHLGPRTKKLLLIIAIAVILVVPFLAKIMFLIQNRKTNKAVTATTAAVPTKVVGQKPRTTWQDIHPGKPEPNRGRRT